MFVIPSPPDVETVTELLRSVIDPELGADIVTLGMVPVGRRSSDDGVVTVGVKLTIGGCPLRAQIKKDVETRVAVHPGVTEVQDRLGRDDQRGAHRGHAQGALERSRERTRHRGAAHRRGSWPSPAARAASARASVTVNLAAAIAAEGFTVGVLDADIWGFSVPRLLGIDDRLEAAAGRGQRQADDHPRTSCRSAAAC